MNERIAVNPAIHFGKPCVAGTRIPVQNVLELVREGLSFAEIIRDYYPDLEPEDIRACLQYAIDVVAAEDIHPRQRHEVPRRPGCVCHAVHAELERVLTMYSEQELQASFVVTKPGRHRMRKPRPGSGP
jgi:uncharacterized protein (DUF433 family)